MFTWIPFYKELAEALLRFKDDRTPLVEWCHDTLSKVKITQDYRLEKYIGEYYTDIDPLTLFPDIHRGSNDQRRTKLMEHFKTFLSLKCDLPSDYTGVGIISHWNSRNIVSANNYVRNNWNLFEKLLRGEPFATEFDFIVQDPDFLYKRSFPITRVLSWIKPEKYLPLDKKMKEFLRKNGISTYFVMNYNNYINFLEKVKKQMEEGLLPYESFLELQYEANKNDHDSSIMSFTKQNATMKTEYRMPDPIVKTAKKLLDNAGQIILQGAPGCGKTYITTELAVYLCDGQVPASRAALKARYKELEKESRIGFTTFHQSLDYEEFVEGMKPDTENADPSTGSGQVREMRFAVKPGIFKRMCERAGKDNAPHVLIIDEINRANISKVLGELITLIEKTKRVGAEDEFCVTLPYSGEHFGVPQNLYIIGTMNTADRSLGYIDYAIRRRFAFLPLKSEWAVVREFYGDRGELMNRQHELYTRIRNLVKDHLNEDFLLDDVMIGHSYFLAATEEDYKLNLDYKIRPLLEEYLRDGILVEDGTVKDTIKNLR